MRIGDRVTTPTGTGTIETIIGAKKEFAFRRPYRYGPYARIRYPRGRVDVWAFDKIKEAK